MSARMLYPTNDGGGTVPYLDPNHASDICAELMKAAAPGLLKRLGFMLHTWRLARLGARRNAQPLRRAQGGRLPLAVFSHGLTGSSEVYSFQALSLAAEGFVVLMITHTDGSAALVKRRDSGSLAFDTFDRHRKGDEVDLVREFFARLDPWLSVDLSMISPRKNSTAILTP